MYVTGCSSLARTWESTAPSPTSDASVWTIRGREKSGVIRMGSEQRAPLRVAKAPSAASVHFTRSGRTFRVRSFRGLARVAKPGINLW